jgi:hypothetical protein
MTGFSPFQALPQGGLESFFLEQAGGGGFLAEKQRPETPD